MKILTTGRGRSGSWQCRGVQLGGKVGDVIVNARADQIKKYDLVIAVKRLTPTYIRMLNSTGVPWVWDVVDFYPQPECYDWCQARSIAWAKHAIKKANPHGVIYANKRMKNDISIDGVTVYHHGRSKVPHNPIREKVKVVGYEGSAKYLGRWEKYLRQACDKRGWQFRTDVPLDKMDIVIALRDRPYNGYAQHHWKSNVKLANAQLTGTPFIGNPEDGYLETQSGAEVFIEDFKELDRALDSFEDHKTRLATSFVMKESTLSLIDCAREVKKYGKRLLNTS